MMLYGENGSPHIGNKVWIGPYCIIDGTGGLTIGDECDISSGVHIYTHSTHQRCVHGKENILKPVVIGHNTFIGANTVILPGVTIGDHNIIGACSLVNCDIPSNETWGGNPIRRIK